MYIPFEIERFEVRGLLGMGGEGQVYLLYDKEKMRMVAAKVSEDAERLKQQMLLLHQMGEEICPVVYGMETVEGKPVLYMEYVLGESLEQYRMRRGQLGAKEAVMLLARIMDAICLVHQKGVTYLDIKPSNIFLRADGRICLLDFGAARKTGSHGKVSGGTYGYAAPEQFWTGVKADERSDVYAMGKLLVYLVTDKNPAHPPYEDHLFLRDMEPAMRDIVLACTNSDMQKRYRDLLSLKKALYDVLLRKRSWFFREKRCGDIICEKSIWKSDYLRE